MQHCDVLETQSSKSLIQRSALGFCVNTSYDVIIIKFSEVGQVPPSLLLLVGPVYMYTCTRHDSARSSILT